MNSHVRGIDVALLLVFGALFVEQTAWGSRVLPLFGSHFGQSAAAILLALVLVQTADLLREGVGFPGLPAATGMEHRMPCAFRIAFLADLVLLAIEVLVPSSKLILPITGNHLVQAGGLAAVAYVYLEARDIWHST